MEYLLIQYGLFINWEHCSHMGVYLINTLAANNSNNPLMGTAVGRLLR